MFNEILYNSLLSLMQVQYSEPEIRRIADYISDSIEMNPREGNNISLLRDSILNYLNHPVVLEKHKQLVKSRTEAAQKLSKLDTGIAQLDKLNSIGLKSRLEGSVIDQTSAKEIYLLNFGYKQNLGEILYQIKHNQGGKLGF